MSDEKAKRLLEAADEMLLGGSHDGPCDNADDPWSECEAHQEAHARREANLRAAIDAMTGVS